MTSMLSKQMGNQPSKRPQFFKLVKRGRYLLLMLLPITIYYIIFHYLPMTGIIIAFKNFIPGRGIYYGEWVGLKWFKQFMSSPYFPRLIRNTVLISGYSILLGFPVPILPTHTGQRGGVPCGDRSLCVHAATANRRTSHCPSVDFSSQHRHRVPWLCVIAVSRRMS